MSVSAFKNKKKSTKRRRAGKGHRDLEQFPTEFGPSTSGRKLNFYGHMTRGRVAKMKRVAAQLRAADSDAKKASIVGRTPLWLQQLLGRRRG